MSAEKFDPACRALINYYGCSQVPKNNCGFNFIAEQYTSQRSNTLEEKEYLTPVKVKSNWDPQI